MRYCLIILFLSVCSIERGIAASPLDADIGHSDPARPSYLQAQTALRSMRRASIVRVLQGTRSRAGSNRRSKAFRCTAKNSSASSLTRSRQFRDGFAMPCATSQSSSTTSRRPELLEEMEIEPPRYASSGCIRGSH